jgi:hypothetical protein
MPTYTFRDNNTGEQFERMMKIAEREEYLQQNPHIESLIVSAPAFAGDHITIKINERVPVGMKQSGSSQL